MGDNVNKYSDRHVKIRTIASGSKTVAAGDLEALEIDSGTTGAEILSILIKGVNSAKWTLDVYIPTVDDVLIPEAADKREDITWDNVLEGGLISGPISIPYNMFLVFTNTG